MRDPVSDPKPLRLPVLTAAECEDWVLHVSLMSGHWRRRHARAPFFTLGQAAYLDCGPGPGDYHDPAARQRNNTLLRSRFLPLLERVAAVLAQVAGTEVRLVDMEAALPGFHIYLPHPAFTGPVAKRHRDLQFQQAFPGRRGDAGDVFSFTLPLSCPPGGGLSLWPDPDGPRHFVPYVEGEIVVHDGLVEHRAELDCTGDVERITLQGHGIRRDGRHLLYW